MLFHKIVNSWPFYDMEHDFIYGVLMRIRHPFKNHISMELIERIKALESGFFPNELVGYSDLKSKKEFLETMRCTTGAQLDYYIDENLLFLAVRHYNCTLIRDMGITAKDPKKVFGLIKQKIDEYVAIGKPVYMEARESTIYKIVKFYEKRKYYSIAEDKPISKGEETFHRLKLVKYGSMETCGTN